MHCISKKNILQAKRYTVPYTQLQTPVPQTLLQKPVPLCYKHLYHRLGYKHLYHRLLQTPAPKTLLQTPVPQTLLQTPVPKILLQTPVPQAVRQTPVPKTLLDSTFCFNEIKHFKRPSVCLSPSLLPQCQEDAVELNCHCSKVTSDFDCHLQIQPRPPPPQNIKQLTKCIINWTFTSQGQIRKKPTEKTSDTTTTPNPHFRYMGNREGEMWEREWVEVILNLSH